MGHLPTPVDDNRKRLVDRGSQALCDFQTIGASFRDVVVGLDVKGFLAVVASGTLTARGVLPVSVAYLDAAAVVNSGGGTVTIACAGHGFSDGDTVRFYQPYGTSDGVHVPLTQYPATYTVLAAGDADHIAITATYAAKTPTALYYAIGYRDLTYAVGEAFGLPIAVKQMQPLFQGKGACTLKLQLWR